MTITTAAAAVEVADGTTMQIHTACPAGRRPAVGVIVAHELFGVNPDMLGVAAGLAEAGYLTAVPEFYHRVAPPGRWLERTDAGRQEGFRYLHQLTREAALADTAAAMDWLSGHPGIGRVAIIGFSAGGHLAYLAACKLPLAAAAVLYAGWLPTTEIPMSQPSPTLDLTPGITGRLLFLTGEDDTLIGAAERGQIRDALERAGTSHELVTYPGAGHAFFWPGTPSFHQAARDDAWSRVLAMLAG